MPKTILLIDDSPTIRSVIKVYLMTRKFEFLDAENGERGLQLVRLLPVDLVIADVKMPVIDGISFLRQVRADTRPQLKNLPIILLTGDKSEELRKEGLGAGATAFLHKPISNTQLCEAVDKIIPPG